MARKTIQQQLFDRAGTTSHVSMNDIIAIGTVVDTNDPMQLGRIRAVVSAWGDSWDHDIDALPWCMYVTPFGGDNSVGTRGSGLHQTEGGVSYGIWGIPKIGAQVVVTSLDEQRIHRLWIGCVYTQYTNHTMPHGRWITEDHPKLEKDGYGGESTKHSKPYGPFSSMEKPIQPLADNMSKAFGGKSGSYEWKTRVADYAVARVDVSSLESVASGIQDDLETADGDWSSTQGYQNSRIDPMGNKTGKNYDSHVYSITSPGFHALSMDDRLENCRVRIRTTGGHQIIMDDTNERIYIATAQGNNWIEMDQAGNIDLYTSGKVNVRAKEDINLTSDKSIRMHAKEGIHMHSDKEIRMTAKQDFHILTDQTIRAHAKKNILMNSDKETNLFVGDKFKLYSDADLSIKTNSNVKIQAAKQLHVKTGGDVKISPSGKFHVKGPTADSADKSQKPNEKPALYTNRVPAAEPWARTMTKADDTHDPELQYDDPRVGKQERGKKIPRGYYWRR